ncbi:hypothetical protein ARSEF1564_009070 [Beauveria bassiana]
MAPDSSSTEPLRHIRRVLIANRGEIAVRCIKACKELGVYCITIFTNADTTSLHAKLADESVLLPGDNGTAYTDSASILEICKRVGADAVIPGYGFLSENAEFADAVTAAGIVFVGPSSASIRAMGLKHEARAIAVAANVPVIPGTSLLESADDACVAARALGFPVMLKATGGGGGMGLQVCHTEQEVTDAFSVVKSRGSTLFKNSGVFLEKYYPSSRHVEVQVAGNGEIVVAFGERECSLQRRHQKVIEECPSPFVERHPGMREKMCRAATNYASRLKYKSVGTVEFLVDDETADFFFLEMNTRLQVEHGITELCYGVDLVHLMLRQADHERAGRLGIHSDELQRLVKLEPHGWAIEGRVYAEVPLRNFAPAPGILQRVGWAEGDGIRVDTWVSRGQNVTPYYDPLIAKIMVHSLDGRSTAQAMMLKALNNSALQGTQTNMEYLAKIIASPMFVNGQTLTNSLSNFHFESCSLQVLDPGVLTTLQDHPGRVHVGHGIPPGGPMDDLSARVANILVGNEPGAELLEITLVGPELLFHEAAVVAVCGAELLVTLEEQTQPMWSRLIVGKGQTLKLGRVGKDGTRTYLAVKGGFPQVADYLGSKSTAPELGIGGVQGRKLQAHDILALDPRSGTWAKQASPLSLPKEGLPIIFDSDSATVIRCIDGPYGSEDILSPEGHATLYEAEWSVSHNSSRSGVRLSGPRLKWARTSGGGGGSHPSNVFDYGYPNGGVNFTGESPIIFAHDRPGLGGFACPTTVCSAEMWKVGQLKTGNKVRFQSISFDDALQLSKSKGEYLQAIKAYSNGGTRTIPSPHVEVAKAPASSILHQIPASGSHPRVTYRQGGDTGIIVEYGEQLPDLRNTACVYLLLQGLSRAQLPGVRGEPNFATLTVHFNQQSTPRESLLARLIQLDREAGEITGIQIPARQLRLPVCLDHSSFAESNQRYMENIRPTAAYMPDNVEYLRKNNALDSRQDVFDSILKAPWLTVAVGFFVGTPILYPMDPWRVITGQKYNPTRIYTPRGSIGLGGSLAAIYPVAAPGGYQLMGRTLGGWDAAGNRPGFSPDKPWLFNQFDLVKFHQVSEAEYTKIEQDFDAGRYVFDIAETTINMDQYIAQFDEAARDPQYQEWKRRKEVASKEMAELEEKLYEEWVEAKRLATADAIEHEGDEESENVALIKSPVDANVWRVLVKEGDEIQKGQTVAILEAMKMEINMIAGDKEAGFVVAGIPQPPGSVTQGSGPLNVLAVACSPGTSASSLSPPSLPENTIDRASAPRFAVAADVTLAGDSQQNCASLATDERLPQALSYHPVDMSPSVEVDWGLHAMQTEAFSLDFLPNETEVIDNYFLGILHPTNADMDPLLNTTSLSTVPGALPSTARPDTTSYIQTRTPAITNRNYASSTTPSTTTPQTAMRQSPSRIPGPLDAMEDVAAANPWTISSSAYARLQTEVNKFSHVLPAPFTLPSRPKLSRFIASWMRGYHPHLPFLHIPTANIDTMKPMLVLTLAATGSFYGFEHTEGYPMYVLAKAMITNELEKRRVAATLCLLHGLPQYAELPTDHSASPIREPATHHSSSQPPAFDVELLQALLVLIMTMSWLDAPFAQEALAMSSQLSTLTREALSQARLDDDDDDDANGGSWIDWGKAEERRRSIFAAYFTLNIQTICFNVPPQLTNSEMKLLLPCCEAEFRAPNADAWNSVLNAKPNNTRKRDYQDCLAQLLAGKPLEPAVISEFGNYLLVQSLLMQIYLERQAVSPLLGPSQNLPAATVAVYDRALAAWQQSCWDPTIETTSLDPSTSAQGPVAFNAAAVLRLAHVHLGAGLQAHCELLTRDPRALAEAFSPVRNPLLLESARAAARTTTTTAVRHAVCALRIPVRVGIAFVARGRTGHWSAQHAISNYACALLLTHWLDSMTRVVAEHGGDDGGGGGGGLEAEERMLLGAVERLVEETHLECSLGPKKDGGRPCPGRMRRLSIAALRLWAQTCQGIQVYEIVHVVGEALSIAADLIERGL